MRKLIFGLIVIIVGAIALSLWFWHRSGGLQSAAIKQIGRQLVSNPNESNLIPKVLGFNEPQTYLVLFLNNTELRPAGGFIGAYSVVRIDKGVPEILKVEGTELLDNRGPKDFLSVPPEPLQKYLSIKRWDFRDSNWSPDFASSATKAMELFVKQKGVAADEVDSVIGITPTLLEEILKISGPISVNGHEFNTQNFTEKLEYEVEYGYAKQGLDFDSRKKVLADLTHALLARLRADIFMHWSRYLVLAQKMLAEKHVLVFSKDPEIQSVLLSKNWGGEINQTAGDYLLWADANLASLKTDKVIDRELYYSFAPTNTGEYLATVKMKYVNNGSFTPFTTRYRTYARVFLPIGSRFISAFASAASLNEKNAHLSKIDAVDHGIESGKQWFGAFISIEPGKTGELAWQFYLSPQVVKQIENNSYSLLAQKQAGTINGALTLKFDFGKNITSAVPPEAGMDSENQSYDYKTDLRVDRVITIKLQ